MFEQRNGFYAMSTKHETKAEPLKSGDIFARTYSIPLYQRGYAWGREEIWQLLDDLKEAFDSDRDRNYYIGSFTAFLRTDVSGRQTYELIDGQQRAITLSLLLRLLAQFVPSKIPSFRLSEHLRFENRPDAESFLATFDEHPDEAPMSPAPFRRAVDAMLDHPVFGVKNRVTLLEFAKFVRSHVVAFLITMPPETDVSAYFEIMNNRGIQLEFHELLKAKLMAKLPDDVDKVLFDLLWTACSRMDGYFAEYLDEKTATALEKGESWIRLGRDSVKICNLIVDGSAIRSVIPDFPNFLLHALRVYMNDDIAAPIQLDERQMRRTFDEHLDTIAPGRFLDILIQTRIRFDRFVIKADGGAEGVEIRWRVEGKNDWMPADRERLIHLQSMLQVSNPSRRNKEWLSRLLCAEVEDAPGLIALLESFARERLLREHYEVEFLHCLGTGTPHLALNLIDYLMYCAKPAKYSGAAAFKFAYRNSVEHHFPQGSENETWTNDVVNDIGNLYLLSKSDNSALNVRSPKEKVTLAGRLDSLPPKRREMYQLTQAKDWTPEVMRHHSDEVLKLLGLFLSGNGSDRMFAGQGTPIGGASAQGDVRQEKEHPSELVNFSTSQYLKDIRGCTLGLEEVWTDDHMRGWERSFADGVYLSSWQRRVQSNLGCELWWGKQSFRDGAGDFLTEPFFTISHNGKTFNLGVNGEFWGNWPEEKYKGIDFEATEIQNDLAAAEAAYCSAWKSFGIDVKIDENIGHNPKDIWWNVTIPFKDHDELVSDEFSQKLRGSLARVAAAFASLLPYRVSGNNNQ